MIPKECKLLAEWDFSMAEGRRDCYWLYMVTNCAGIPKLQESIHNSVRFDWNEMTKITHYYLSINTLAQSMQLQAEPPLYGKRNNSQGEDINGMG